MSFSRVPWSDEESKRRGCLNDGTERAAGKEFGVTELDNRFVEGNRTGSFVKFVLNADCLLPDGWCHVNRNETVQKMMGYYDLWQATGDLGKPDLLSNRVFGALTRTLHGRDETLFITAVTSLQPCASIEEWRERTTSLLESSGWRMEGEKAARERHQKGWNDFWARSWIEISSNASETAVPSMRLPLNPKLPISYGRDSRGGTKLEGTIQPVSGNVFTPSNFQFAATFTTKDAKNNQRLVDNITPGSRDGFLVDLYNQRVRVILGPQLFSHPTRVTSHANHTVSLTVTAKGAIRLTLDGVPFTTTWSERKLSPAETCVRVQRAWQWQRYVSACAGRGKLPIRFNGSIFTTEEQGNPDFRRWGHGYWWQNTRLPYYPLLVSGDADEMMPLFNMYFSLRAFLQRRTQKYLNHAGIYFPECIQPWGDHFIGTYGCKPWAECTDKLQEASWHKYEWVGQLELALMALDYRDFTGDDAWFREQALPSIREYVRFFDAHYKLNAEGRYDWYPAQALETWIDCMNPMPEVAGLTRVTERLLALPSSLVGTEDRALFTKIHSRIPQLPTRTLDNGTTVFAQATKWGRHSNVETPELYCVFPFRLCSFEKSTAEMGRRTYAARPSKTYRGWNQDELFAAYLGMAEETRSHLVNRVVNNHDAAFRWPTYWQPNFDWRPDQCAGGNIQNMFQSMLLQWDGKRIFLAPAWPKDWDCEFRLHAPFQTTIEGTIQKGQLTLTRVTPESRRADIVICPVQ